MHNWKHLKFVFAILSSNFWVLTKKLRVIPKKAKKKTDNAGYE